MLPWDGMEVEPQVEPQVEPMVAMVGQLLLTTMGASQQLTTILSRSTVLVDLGEVGLVAVVMVEAVMGAEAALPAMDMFQAHPRTLRKGGAGGRRRRGPGGPSSSPPLNLPATHRQMMEGRTSAKPPPARKDSGTKLRGNSTSPSVLCTTAMPTPRPGASVQLTSPVTT